MKTLIIFALIALFSCDLPYIDDEISFLCPDDKIKVGDDVCAIKSSESSDTSTFDEIVYIKKKCGKNEGCFEREDKHNIDTDESDTIYTCLKKKIKYLKIGKKCNYNADCYTSYCKNGKCAAYGSESCNENYNCGPGKYCKEFSSNDTCTAYAKENEDCSNLNCAPGFFCDTATTSPTCKKYFSLEKGSSISDDYFPISCKSYFARNKKCAEVTKVEEDCSITYNDGKEDHVETVDEYSEGSLYITVGDQKVCLNSNGRKELINKLINRYNKIELNKLLENEYCDYERYLCDKKYAELIRVVIEYDYLLLHDFIKTNGERNKGKKCEYEFWKSTISSSFINVYFGFTFTLFSLLF